MDVPQVSYITFYLSWVNSRLDPIFFRFFDTNFLHMPRHLETSSQTHGRYSDSHVLQQDWFKDVQLYSADLYLHFITGGAN